MEPKDRFIRRRKSSALWHLAGLASGCLLLWQATCRAQSPPPAAPGTPCTAPTLIKGYYVVSFHEGDVQSARQRAGGSNKATPFDMPTTEGFIALDSITPKHSLAANLQELFTCGHNTAYVLPVSPQFSTFYCRDSKQVNSLPAAIPRRFALENLVVPKNRPSEVYKLYYLEGMWSKFQIANSPAERRLTENVVARQCAAGPAQKFEIICCLNILTSVPYQPSAGEGFSAY